jgi:hypothetical protein
VNFIVQRRKIHEKEVYILKDVIRYLYSLRPFSQRKKQAFDVVKPDIHAISFAKSSDVSWNESVTSTVTCHHIRDKRLTVTYNGT